MFSKRHDRRQCDGRSYTPQHQTDTDTGAPRQMAGAEGKLEHQEAVESDDTDGEGRHLVRQERQEA